MQTRRIGCFFVVLALGVMHARAQNASGLDAEVGTKPYHSYQGGDIDRVDLISGKLQVTIPLISYEQRGGKLRVDYALIYHNTGMFIPGCFANPAVPGTPCVVWPFDNGFFPVPAGPGGGISCAERVVSDALGNQYFDYPCSAGVVSPDGASHVMVPTSPTSFMAADGSGYRVDLLPGSDVTNINHQASVITTPDGVRYPGRFFDQPVANSVYAEDSNGNQILNGDGGIIDTLGRVIASEGPGGVFPVSLPGPFPAGIGISDFSGCSGPLPVVGAVVWNLPGIDGGSYAIKFCFVAVNEVNPGTFNNSEFCGAGGTNCQQFDTVVLPEPTTSIQLQSVVLPNGTTWTFEYTTDGFGNLSRITTPAGGTISYTWTPMDQNGAIINSLPPMTVIKPQGIATRTVDPHDGSSPAGTWSYNYVRGTVNFGLVSGTFVTTVTDAGNNDTVHKFSVFDAEGDPLETLTQYYGGPASGGHLLRTVQTDYNSYTLATPAVSGVLGQVLNILLPIRHTTTLDNGLQSKTEQDWDPGFAPSISEFRLDLNNQNLHALSCGSACGGSVPYGVIMATREYDYGQGAPGPLVRTTTLSRPAFGDSRYLANNLLNLVSQKTLSDGAGNVVASATTGYDETALISSGISTNLDPNPPAGLTRGNPTSMTQVVTVPADTCNSNMPASTTVTHRTNWFDTGQPAQMIDPLGNVTTNSYSSNFAGAFITKSCNALNQCSTFDYDLSSGLRTSATDVNHQTTSYQYDIMGRLQQTTTPAQILNGSAINGTVVNTYNDTPGSVSVSQSSMQDGNTSITRIQFRDGLMRPIGTRNLDPEGDVFSTIVYDSFGRAANISNSYRTLTDPTYGTTQTQHDALGRVVQVTRPDGSTVLTNYSGRASQLWDEGNGFSRISRISQNDVFGRLVSVCEVTSATQVDGSSPSACGQDIPGTGFLTTYQYDLLGNLKRIQQGSMVRSFAYDGALRRINATNPESGTTCYTYDANGNMLTRTRPAPNQSNPSTTVTTTYRYDALNRLTNISYSDSVTPSVTRHYDTSSEMGVSLDNTVGRLSAEYVTSPGGQILSGHIYSYDSMGRVIDNSQCTPQNCGASLLFPIQSSFDLLGHPLTSSNGTGVVFTSAYNAAGQLTAVTSSLSDANHPATLLGNTQYGPLGGIVSDQLGNAVKETFVYDGNDRITSYVSAQVSQPTSFLNEPLLRFPGIPDRFNSISREGTQNATLLLPPRRRMFHHNTSAVIRIAHAATRRGERGMFSVTIRSLDIAIPSLTFKVAYRGEQSATSVAGNVAHAINKQAAGSWKAVVQRFGHEASVKLQPLDFAGPQNFIASVSVSSNRNAPSFRATMGSGSTVSLLVSRTTSWRRPE